MIEPVSHGSNIMSPIGDRWLGVCSADSHATNIQHCELYDSHTSNWTLINNIPSDICPYSLSTVGLGNSWLVVIGGNLFQNQLVLSGILNTVILHFQGLRSVLHRLCL